MKIGIFDSGLGGLFTGYELYKYDSNHEYLLFLDSDNFPFGLKSDKELILIINKAISFFEENKVDLIIIACNTASQIIIKYKITSNIKIVNIVSLTIDLIKQTNNLDNLLVIATKSTIDSKIYEKSLKLNTNIESKEAGDLIKYIEDNSLDVNKVKEAIKSYIKENIKNNYSHILLGCTHFLPFKKVFSNNLKETIVISPINYLIKEINLNSNKSLNSEFKITSSKKEVYQKVFELFKKL